MSTFQTVEQLQATIASQAAQYADLCTQVELQEVEIDRLRELLLEVSTYFHGAIKANILKALQPKEDAA